ncbi:MAG: ATP-dependent Clp protease adaptor ClpS [Flavobacteriales bacterium]|nr:ATP-dependent Clp protease adaptor ClpS [Flavobacteriales bacterium]
MFHQTEELEEVEVLDEVLGGYALVIFNDDVNTFDHVISCLVKYCDHTPEQAEQCSLIIHYKGKCAVKFGGSAKLQSICDALCRKGLSAVVEQA